MALIIYSTPVYVNANAQFDWVIINTVYCRIVRRAIERCVLDWKEKFFAKD